MKEKKLSPKEKKLELSLKLSLRIRELFAEKKIDPKAFFIESKLPQRKWYRLFDDNANPTFHTLCEVAEALKVHPMELLNINLEERIKRVYGEPEPWGYVPRYIERY